MSKKLDLTSSLIYQNQQGKESFNKMKSVLRTLSLFVLSSIITLATAQTSLPQLEAELSTESEVLTQYQRASKKRSQQAYEEVQRCLGVISVPGDVRVSAAEIEKQSLELEADDIELPDNSTVILKGNAFMQQGPQKISAGEIRYSKNDDTVQAKGKVELFSPKGDKLSASDLNLEIETFTGAANDIDYFIANRNYHPETVGSVFVSARGKATSAQFLGHDIMELQNVSYTNCAQGNDDVVIKAGSLVLDHAAGVGTARNATLKFLGVPIFYLPYITFPINSERKTGLLAATFGTDSESGFFIGVPYYWNISPGMDATITPRFYSDRGAQLSGEFRYLTKKSEGELNIDHLPGDDLYSGEDRTALTFYHSHDVTEKLYGEVDFQWASDDDYYDDFSSGLYLNSATYLTRSASLNYLGDVWRFKTGVSKYLTLDDSIAQENRPYGLLPYFNLQGNKSDGPWGLNYNLEASAIQFDNDDKVNGWRYLINPSVSLPLERIYGYITPKIGINYAGYSLDNTQAGAEDAPYRYVTTASIDSGLFFERDFNWGDKTHIQTLEPRLFYVYIPKEDQAAIPDFDTSELNLNNFSNIFRENRFIGPDRIGDTNQVTLGLTSRFINDETGEQKGKISVGQIYYLEDREISLASDDANIDESKSDFLTEASVSLNDDWSLYGYAAWDPQESENRVRRFSVNYGDHLRGRNYFSLSYYFNRDADDDEQIDLQGGWRINSNWSIYMRDIYSIKNSENRYISGGIRYDACCWKLSVGGERRLDKGQGERDALFVTLELTGLTKVNVSQGF